MGGSHSSVLSVVLSPSQPQRDRDFIVSNLDDSAGCAYEDEVDEESTSSDAGESSGGGSQEEEESVYRGAIPMSYSLIQIFLMKWMNSCSLNTCSQLFLLF